MICTSISVIVLIDFLIIALSSAFPYSRLTSSKIEDLEHLHIATVCDYHSTALSLFLNLRMMGNLSTTTFISVLVLSKDLSFGYPYHSVIKHYFN